MKTKTAYRPKKPEDVISQPDRPVVAENIEPQSEPKPAPPVEEKSEAETYAEETAKADASKAGIVRELEALQRAEQYNRQTAQAPQRPPSRDEILQQWRQHGMTAEDEAFLKQHPQLIDGYELTAYAANEAAKEHKRGTAEHREATLKVFDETLARLQAQMAANNQTPQPTPQFFEPPPQPRQAPRSAGPSSYVSAPVSRRDGPSGDYGADLPTDPSKIRLSADQVEAARIAGVTPAEYARQLIRMKKMQASGEVQP